MEMTSTLLLAAVLAGPAVQVSTLNGEQHSGQLVSLSNETLKVTVEGKERSLPVANLLELHFAGAKGDDGAADKAASIRLTDGSQISCSEMTTSAKKVACVALFVGRFEVSPSAVAALRFAPADRRVEADWQELLQRTLKRDLLVIRKGDVLDYQDGIVGDIDDKIVKFSLEGEEIPIKREKVFGVIYARRPASKKQPLCRLDIGKRDELFVSRIEWSGEKGSAVLVAGATVEFKTDALRAVDYSLGKVQYLSQMEPRSFKFTPARIHGITPFPAPEGQEYRRDRSLNGPDVPLRIGRQTFARGLALHSQTKMSYRIGQDFRRFQAVIGIDAGVASNGNADAHFVHLVISGDGRTLLETDVRARDPARPIDLDVTGVRDLEIFVDFGGDDLDPEVAACDYLDLADAKVVK
jgi:hypothetical protein